MRPTQTRSSMQIDLPNPRLRAAFRRVLLVCAAALAALPAAAQDNTLSSDSLNLTSSTSLLDSSSLTLDSSTLTLTDTITVLDTNLRLDAPTLQIDDSITRLTTTDLTLDGVATIDGGGLRSAEAIGLGRLVAPGNAGANIVVGRLGTAPQAGNTNLTVDFVGDGLINFEIAPGIVEIPTDAAGRGDDALGGLVGQPITMATATADRVLDSVINIAGVTPATTFEMANGTVVLGGSQPRDVVGVVDIPVPDDSPSRGPGGTDGRDPAGSASEQPGEICLSHGCYPVGSSDPKPGAGPDLEGVFNFSGFRRPPTPESAQSTGTDELLNVSIMLPLRGREREGDQFSNHGNEEIW